MSNEIASEIYNKISTELDIPDGAYEKAAQRYNSIGDWLRTNGSACSAFDPHILPQGSFRLGTVTKPISTDEAYDLDLTCRLEAGVSQSSHTQEEVAELVRKDLESYRNAKGIEEPVEAKNRCWRLNYADGLSFHMDIIPTIPESAGLRQVRVNQLLNEQGMSAIAQKVAEHSNNITDRQHPAFSKRSLDWYESNTEGYAIWFESRIRLGSAHVERRLLEAKAGTMDKLPAYKWKSPLQRAIQILKRHRDVMFSEDGDKKPISIIITTLAARAYQGEASIEEALSGILSRMGQLVNRMRPHVPNPVKPSEDFADKWYDDPELKVNFEHWLRLAIRDLQQVAELRNAQQLSESIKAKFSLSIAADKLTPIIGLGAPAIVTASEKVYSIDSRPTRPWGSS